MINKMLFPTILTVFFLSFIVSCSAKDTIENKEQIKKEISIESTNELNVDYTNFNGFNMVGDNVNFKIDGKILTLNLPIYLDKNRYYISLNEFIDQLNGKIYKIDNLLNITINDNSYSVNLLDNIVTAPNIKFPLKKSLLNDNDIYYIGFSDFSHMLNLYTRWDKDKKIISCKTDSNNMDTITPYQSKIDQIGLIRFEDVGLSSQPYGKDYFERLRIISNYMKQKKIPYHIAWIPRYMIPSLGVDNDPLTKNNFEIAEMVYSLDY